VFSFKLDDSSPFFFPFSPPFWQRRSYDKSLLPGPFLNLFIFFLLANRDDLFPSHSIEWKTSTLFTPPPFPFLFLVSGSAFHPFFFCGSREIRTAPLVPPFSPDDLFFPFSPKKTPCPPPFSSWPSRWPPPPSFFFGAHLFPFFSFLIVHERPLSYSPPPSRAAVFDRRQRARFFPFFSLHLCFFLPFFFFLSPERLTLPGRCPLLPLPFFSSLYAGGRGKDTLPVFFFSPCQTSFVFPSLFFFFFSCSCGRDRGARPLSRFSFFCLVPGYLATGRSRFFPMFRVFSTFSAGG